MFNMRISRVHDTLSSGRERTVDALQRQHLRGASVAQACALPSREVLEHWVYTLMQALFPLHFGPDEFVFADTHAYVADRLVGAMGTLKQQLTRELAYHQRCGSAADQLPVNKARVDRVLADFESYLPELKRLLCEDAIAAYEGDPAATSTDEVLLCYPGMRAIIHHRIAHFFYQQHLPLMARVVAELAHSATGIDIHPGATIGEHFFIDHGTGVVIGESTIIGRNVRLYQAVTLGAKRFEVDADGHLARGGARHPVVEDDVVIYAGATLLGRITVGQGAVIGGNVWVTHDVPAHDSVTQKGSASARG